MLKKTKQFFLFCVSVDMFRVLNANDGSMEVKEVWNGYNIDKLTKQKLTWIIIFVPLSLKTNYDVWYV